ncbi:M91 family zinc metallopeptidase [Dyella sp. 2RAB6]|uniref:M91 family zinc metallopeptidase n=1 Tax=Dyella sp. 2RAB6 TaxID=3232992 RepID=UPI003F8FAE46
MPKDSLRARVANKIAEANRTGAAPVFAQREQRLVPALVRSPRAGFTPGLLQAQKQQLRRVEEVRVHGGLDHVHVKRAAGQDAGAFADLAADARRSMHTLMSKPDGERMMKEIDTRSAQNRAHAGDNAKVHISSTRPTDASNMNAPHIAPGLEQGYRFAGKEGKGWGSEVRVDPNEAKFNRFVGLGHEMVHAHRLAHGKAVGVPQINQANHPLFNDPISQGARVERGQNAEFGAHLMNVVQHANHLQEEFETVGLSKTPRGAFNPSENMLRAEHGLRARTDYSKAKPGAADDMIAKGDALFDNRSAAAKLWHGISSRSPAPTPVSDMVKRYKD